MALSRSSLFSIPLSFASVSVGTPDTPLESKLHAISSAGFQGIELGFPDLLSFAKSSLKKDIAEDDYVSLCTAGREVKALCKKHNLQIMMLQPFSNFEGWAPGSKEREDAFARARGWIEIMHAVGTDMLQVGSTDSPNISTDLNTLANDLRELADLLAPHSYRLAYENWCWATVAPTWSKVWETVQLGTFPRLSPSLTQFPFSTNPPHLSITHPNTNPVNRPNIGLCLDTFQTVGSEYADPTTPSGLISTQSDLKTDFAASLAELKRVVPAEKIFVLQISDAYQPPSLLSPSTLNGLRPKGRWSHDFRPFVYEGAYIAQCVEFAKAVLGTGSRAWVSVEVFDGGVDGKDVHRERVGVEEFCKQGMESVRRLLE
ncbi:xylose isomerase-like protein [Hyaloscypha variabilis]